MVEQVDHGLAGVDAGVDAWGHVGVAVHGALILAGGAEFLGHLLAQLGGRPRRSSAGAPLDRGADDGGRRRAGAGDREGGGAAHEDGEGGSGGGELHRCKPVVP